MFIREKFEHVIKEVEPMLEDHYKEVAMYTDKIALDPDYTVYKELQKQDKLWWFTWREEGEIKGYNVFMVQPHPHYKSTTYAMNDIVYIAPEQRHSTETVEFFKHCEEVLRSEAKADVITYHMKVLKTFQTLMTALEFDHAEHLYSKYIGQ